MDIEYMIVGPRDNHTCPHCLGVIWRRYKSPLEATGVLLDHEEDPEEENKCRCCIKTINPDEEKRFKIYNVT